MCAQRRLRSVWASVSARWVAKDPSFLHADSKDTDQSGRSPGWSFAERTCHFVVLLRPVPKPVWPEYILQVSLLMSCAPRYNVFGQICLSKQCRPRAVSSKRCDSQTFSRYDHLFHDWAPHPPAWKMWSVSVYLAEISHPYVRGGVSWENAWGFLTHFINWDSKLLWMTDLYIASFNTFYRMLDWLQSPVTKYYSHYPV